MLSDPVGNLIEFFLMPGDFLLLALSSVAPKIVSTLTGSANLSTGAFVAGLATVYWLVVAAVVHRLSRYCWFLYLCLASKARNFLIAIQRFLRVQRRRTACQLTQFARPKSPDDTIQMEAIYLDEAAQQILLLAKQNQPTNVIDNSSLSTALKISKHKVQHACVELEAMQLLQQIGSGKNRTYKLTRAGHLYLQVIDT